MLTPINLGALRISEECGDLYDVVKHATGYITGTHDVEISGLPITPANRFRLSQWSLIMNAAVVEHEQQTLRRRITPVAAPVVKPPEPVVPVFVKREEPEAIKDAMATSTDDRRRVEIQAADEARGLARIEQYAVEQSLERTAENAAAIKGWLDANVKGYMSQQGVDAAVANLGPRGSNQLTWKPKEAPAPPPPAEPAEVLGTLPDGTTQLPLDVDQFTLSRASKEQARDWLKRHNAGKLLRPHGGFGSSF